MNDKDFYNATMLGLLFINRISIIIKKVISEEELTYNEKRIIEMMEEYDFIVKEQ